MHMSQLPPLPVEKSNTFKRCAYTMTYFDSTISFGELHVPLLFCFEMGPRTYGVGEAWGPQVHMGDNYQYRNQQSDD
eukprot:1302726-Amphidinium_carterae.2